MRCCTPILHAPGFLRHSRQHVCVADHTASLLLRPPGFPAAVTAITAVTAVATILTLRGGDMLHLQQVRQDKVRIGDMLVVRRLDAQLDRRPPNGDGGRVDLNHLWYGLLIHENLHHYVARPICCVFLSCLEESRISR